MALSSCICGSEGEEDILNPSSGSEPKDWFKTRRLVQNERTDSKPI